MIENVCIPNILGPTPSWSLFANFPGLRPSTSLNHLAGKSHGLGGEDSTKPGSNLGGTKKCKKKNLCVFLFGCFLANRKSPTKWQDVVSTTDPICG